MIDKKKKSQAMSLQITEGLAVTIHPDSSHEFLMESKDVAKGYGVSYGNIREHKRVNDEFIEGKHFITAVRISDSDPHNKVYWTKRGVVRLGFFIKSERAKMFRDWAEDLVLARIDAGTSYKPSLPKQRKHNRLTQERLVDILSDVCLIEDKHLRVRITNKLIGR